MKIFLSLLTMVLGLSLAQAQNYTVSLDGAQDGGGARQGSGSGTLSLSGVSLSLNITYSGLSAPATADHIHGPAVPGVNAGVLYPLTSITTLGTSGTINGTVTLVDGTGGFTLAQQRSQLDSGLWYINIHNSVFPGGEIRGQILPVPEPSASALLGLGLAGLACRCRQKTPGNAAFRA